VTLLIVVAALGGWSYDGFADEPSRPAPAAPAAPAPTVPADPPAGRKPPTPAPVVEARKPQPTAPAVPAAAPPPRASVIPPAPTRWRLADASGQAWEHTDIDALRRWVAGRNAALSYRPAQVYRPMFPAFSGTCTSGACYRTR
jgi:hypothetical protein